MNLYTIIEKAGSLYKGIDYRVKTGAFLATGIATGILGGLYILEIQEIQEKYSYLFEPKLFSDDFSTKFLVGAVSAVPIGQGILIWRSNSKVKQITEK